MKNQHSAWTTRYQNPPRIRFSLDTREGRQKCRLRRLARRILGFVFILVLCVCALGYALSVAPTLQ